MNFKFYARTHISDNEFAIVKKFGRGLLELRSMSLERSTIIVFRQRKATSFLSFLEKTRRYAVFTYFVDLLSKAKHKAVAPSPFPGQSSTNVLRVPFVARGGGWHIRVRKYIRDAKEHTHVSLATLYANLRIDQRIVSNVHRVDFAV